MDELGLHLYPRSDRDPVRAGDRWPRAGIVNLARIKQAFWDAFAGTGQPTVEQGLKLRIDEIGWQAVVPAARRDAYHGRETAAATSERFAGGQLREADRDRGLRSQHLRRLSPPPPRRPRPRALPVGRQARRRLGAAGLRGRSHRRRAGEARLRRQARRLAPRDPGHRRPRAVRARRGLASRLRTSWGFNVTAAEEVSYVAAIFPATATKRVRSLASPRAPGAVTMTAGRVRAGWNPRLRFLPRT